MDLIKDLGELAAGSRLRRLSDHLMQEGTKMYTAAKVPFEPRWFPVFALLSRRDAVGITDIARDLGISHAAVNQSAGELEKAGLITSQKSEKDRRKRLLKLSAEGQVMARRVEPIWDDIRGAIREIISDSGVDLMGAVAAIESTLAARPFFDRFEERLKRRQQTEAVIIPFERGNPLHGRAFFDLNRAWVEHLFGGLEQADLKIIEHPEQAILKHGGEIFFALDPSQDKLLGTCALYQRPEDGLWELTKMTVAKEARGRQLGRMLGEAVIAHAKAMGLKSIMLETNSKLTPALTLYRKLGFVAVPITTPSDYVRADIRMVLNLETDEH